MTASRAASVLRHAIHVPVSPAASGLVSAAASGSQHASNECSVETPKRLRQLLGHMQIRLQITDIACAHRAATEHAPVMLHTSKQLA